ncbi:6353_t:CDS:2 [Entrophospora sp. SA101]|nr:6353_t:CDS:2 [Entrophospora sp. SA101]
MYMVDGKIQTCGCSQQIRPLNHLIGMWQLDKEIVKKNEEEGKKLGICMQHFNVDQKYHKNKLKTTISVIDKNIQVSCNGQITCHALNNFGVICKPEVDIVAKAQYICCECYQNHGGHLHVKMGSGKPLFDCEKFGLHNNDHSTSLDLLGKWLLTVAKSENIEYKEKVLMNILNPALQIIKETQEMEAKNSSSKAVIEISTISDLLYTKVPSPFVLKVFLKMHKINLEDTNSFSLNEQSKTFGQNMAKALWNSRTMLLEQKNKIKMPDSLDEYYNALPPFLTLWFPQVMASLSRRPRLLGSMRDLFSTLQIMAHTSGNERKLEIERMNNMKSQISAAQTKHERIGVLFSEYLNDTTTPHGTRAIKTHKETMWDLVNHLLDTFNVADNKALECNLWKTTKPCALNPVGVQRLFDCYTNGHERMNSICRQEVFGTEKIEKKGRRALNITKTTMKNINENKKAEKKTPTQFSDNSLQIQPVQLLDRFLNQVIYKHKPNLIYMNQ